MTAEMTDMDDRLRRELGALQERFQVGACAVECMATDQLVYRGAVDGILDALLSLFVSCVAYHPSAIRVRHFPAPDRKRMPVTNKQLTG